MNQDQTVSLSFIEPLEIYNTVKPFGFNVELGKDIPKSSQSNIECAGYDVELQDARGRSLDDFSTDMQSFTFKSHPATSTRTFSFEPEAINAYCKRMIKLVYQDFAADRVFCYDIRVSV